MAHKHSVYDSDTHLRINPTTRTFAIEGFTKNTIVQHDHNSERFTFELPRVIEGHDMLECNSVQVHYLNVDAKTQETSSGVFVVTDLQESPDDENIAILSWLISSNATKYVGSLNFCIRFACISDENTVDYAWNTAVNTAMRVTDGINNAEVVIEEYADVLEQWRADITSNIYDFLPEALQFGSEISTGGDTLKFDGNSEGKDLVGGMFVQVSNATPTLTTGTVEIVVSGTTNSVPFTQSEVMEWAEGCKCIVIDAPFVAIVTSEAVGVDLDGITFEKEGTYFVCTEEDGMPMYVKSLKIDGCIDFPSIKKLDTKYIDAEWMATKSKSEVVLYDDVVRFNSAGSKTFIEPLFNIVVGKLYEVSFNGTVYTCYGKTYTHSANGNFNAIGNLSLSSKDTYGTPAGEDTGEPFIISSPMQGNISILTSMLTTMGQGDVEIRVVVKEEKINKLPYELNTEPIIFTTTDMASATCNKTYQECVEAINNYCFNGYLIMGTVDVGQIMTFNMITKSKDVVNDVVTREFINFVVVAGSETLVIQYDNNNEITIIIEEA